MLRPTYKKLLRYRKNNKYTWKKWLSLTYPSFFNKIKRKAKKLNKNISEVLYTTYNKNIRNTCLTCGKETVFRNIDIGYAQYCCYKCSNGSDLTREKYKSTCLKKYGVENVSQLEQTKRKVRKTNLKKFGVYYPAQSEDVKKRIKKTNIEKYGGTAPLQNKAIMKKVVTTNLKRYGTKNPFQNEEVRKRYKETLLKKYGVENPSQVKKIQNKIIKSTISHYGGIGFASETINKKIQQTSIKKFGVPYHLQNEDEMEKLKQSNLNNYGVENVSQLDFVKDKIRQTSEERYGGIGLASKVLGKKIRKTMKNLYGERNPSQVPKFAKQAQQTRYSPKEIIIDGKSFIYQGYENYGLLYIYEHYKIPVNNITTTSDKVFRYGKHVYIPDIIYYKNGKEYVVEVKSVYTISFVKDFYLATKRKLRSVTSNYILMICDPNWTTPIVYKNRLPRSYSSLLHKIERKKIREGIC